MLSQVVFAALLIQSLKSVRAQVNKPFQCRFYREGAAAILSQTQGGVLATQENAGCWSLKPTAAQVM